MFEYSNIQTSIEIEHVHQILENGLGIVKNDNNSKPWLVLDNKYWPFEFLKNVSFYIFRKTDINISNWKKVKRL